MLRSSIDRPARPFALWLLALALILLVSEAGCARFGESLTPPEVSLVDLRPLPSESLEQRFEIKLRVLNPNDVTLASDGVDVTLDINGRRLARAIRAEGFSIPRLSEDVVTLVGTTNFLDLFRQAVTLPEASDFQYQLRGRVFLAGSPAWLRIAHEGSLVPDSLRGEARPAR